MGAIELDDLNWQRRRYSPWRAYGQTKLANLLFTLELQRRLDRRPLAASGPMAAHPGLSGTNLFRPRWRWTSGSADFVINAFGQSPAMGALPQLFAATEDIPGGSYVGPDGRRRADRSPDPGRALGRGQRPGLAGRLWSVSEELTGVSYPTE